MDEYIPYIKSNQLPHMSVEKRARQFAPFSMPDGLDEAIKKAQEQEEKEYEVIAEEELERE